MSESRGQLSLSLVEASVGLVLVLAVASLFVVTVPSPEHETTRLETLAADGLDVLDSSRPTDEGTSLLGRATGSRPGFVQERSDLRERLRTSLPPTVRFRLETPHGTVGWTRPPDRPVGRARALTNHGEATLWVWYA